MRTVFADTCYWIAIALPKDELHELAKTATQTLQGAHIITTDEVLAEFLTFLSGWGALLRAKAVALVRRALSNPNVTVVPQTRESFLAGLVLFEQRRDKEYSFTDCISMDTLQKRNLTEVLTNDHHFAQEGFTALLATEAP